MRTAKAKRAEVTAYNKDPSAFPSENGAYYAYAKDGTPRAAIRPDLPQKKSPGDLVVPYHTIAFSQQKLRAALRRVSGQEPGFAYGFVVHSRRQREAPSLGLITLQGESLPLSERLLQALETMPLWLFGHARISLGAGNSTDNADWVNAHPLDRPLTSLVMHISTFDHSAGVTQHLVQVEAMVKADTLVQPLLVLTPGRPAAWPM